MFIEIPEVVRLLWETGFHIATRKDTFPNHDGILRLDYALVSSEYLFLHHHLLCPLVQEPY